MQRQIVRTQISLKYGDDHARWHHAAIYIEDSYLCEARPGGVRYHAVVEFVPHMLIRVRRNAALTESQRFRIAIRALMRLTRSYSYGSAARAWLRSWRRDQFTLNPARPQPRRHMFAVVSRCFTWKQLAELWFNRPMWTSFLPS